MGVFDDHNSCSGVGADYIRLRSGQGWPQQGGLPHAARYMLKSAPSQNLPSVTEQVKPLQPREQTTKVKKPYTRTICACGKSARHTKMCRHCEMLSNHAAKVPGWTCPECGGPKRDVARICATCRYKK